MRVLSFLAGSVLLIAFHAAAVTLQVGRPHIEFLPIPEVAARCGAVSREACTSVHTQMISSCALTARTWKPVTLVRIESNVAVSRATLLMHEFTHLADIRKAVASKAAAMEARRFETEEDCLGFVLESGAAMRQAFLQIESDSNRLRDASDDFAPPSPLAIEIATAAGISNPR